MNLASEPSRVPDHQRASSESRGRSEPRIATVDLTAVISRVTENDAPRWMVVKDNLDHGPFSGKELVRMMLEGEVRQEHRLINMDTGQRMGVLDHAEFAEIALQYEATRKEKEQSAKIAHAEKTEKVSNVAKIIIFVGLATILLAGGAFLIIRNQQAKKDVSRTDLADLYEGGNIDVSGTVGILPSRQNHGKSRDRVKGGGGMSYEAAMNQAVSLGDVNAQGGQKQLPSTTVAQVMNRHIQQLFQCVGAELRQGATFSTVEIDIAIAGSGQVLGSSPRQGSAAFRQCIRGKIKGIRFPPFSAPRMGARYAFNVDS